MKLKQGFIKENWMPMLVVVIFIVASVYMKSLPIIGVTLIFAGALAMNYRKFDEDENKHDNWWKMLGKEQKKKLYEMRNI